MRPQPLKSLCYPLTHRFHTIFIKKEREFVLLNELWFLIGNTVIGLQKTNR
jgi:hypothetical protein